MSVTTGLKVVGFDLNPLVKSFVKDCRVPYIEDRCDEFLAKADIEVVDRVQDVVRAADRIFIAVQTPHESRFEGITPVPEDLADFSYSHLRAAAESIRDALRADEEKRISIVVISTVLPGTMRTEILPLFKEFGDRVKFSYNPYFIAMGTTISDFLDPEFILIGSDDTNEAEELAKFYEQIHNAPVSIMQIESAELAKVAYNTFIGFKIVFANTLAEITEVRGGNVDEITSALSKATNRLMSGKYMKAGMGDGGGCHPRDQIAMSWLAKDAGISADIFGWLAHSRDLQTERQAELILQHSIASGLPVVLLGESYKPDINLTVGSPAKLLQSFLERMNVGFEVFDPFVYPDKALTTQPSVFFVATNHKLFKNTPLPVGSICIDPWGDAIGHQDGVQIIRPGRKPLDI